MPTTTTTTHLREQLRAIVLRRTGVGEIDFHLFKQLRQKLGLTQLEIAGLIGVDRSAFTAWEKGSKAPTADHAKALVEVLDEMGRLAEDGHR